MKITANMVTITRIVLMPIPGYLLYGEGAELLAALAAIILLGLTDWVDGIMARRDGPSVFGGLLDPIADKIFIAVIYLPLTERGVIPIYLTACIFARDFLVTALRTSLSLRGAPMRTSTLAKYKTALQMIGIGYVILYLAEARHPDSPIVWTLVLAPLALPLGLILYRLVKGEKQGNRSVSMLGLMLMAAGIRAWFGPDGAIRITLWVIAIMTVVSGFSYLVDAWSALKGKPGSIKEALRFGLDGLLVPVAFVLVLGRLESFGMSALVILSVTLELATGGLGNLVAEFKIAPRFRWIALKSLCQVALVGMALAAAAQPVGAPCRSLGGPSLALAAAVTLVFTALAFWRHRKVYLAAI